MICSRCHKFVPPPNETYGYAGETCKCGDLFVKRPQTDAAYSVTAQRLYEAHAQYGDLFKGMPKHWDQLDPEEQAAWIAAAKAI